MRESEVQSPNDDEPTKTGDVGGRCRLIEPGNLKDQG